MKEALKKILTFILKAKSAAETVPALKFFTAGVLCFGLLFRLGNYAAGNNPVYIRMGDVNGDGIVSAADVLGLVKLVMQNSDENQEHFVSADMNADGKLSSADVFSLVRLLGGSGSEITEAESVELSSEAVNLYVGNKNAETVLTASVLPENATVQEIIWSSTDESVVTVENGRLTAVGEGEAYVLATSGDGHASSKCFVKVGIGVTSVEFSMPEIYIYEDSAPILLVPTIMPENATNRSLVWQSSNWDIVSVDSMGGITPHGIGTAVIGASSVEGSVTAACTVHVLPEEGYAETEYEPDISAQRLQKSGIFTNYLFLSRTLDSMLDIQCGFYNISYNSLTMLAEASEIAEYVNPENYSDGAAKYQFLDLSVPNNMSANELNEYLSGKGILSGMGQAFIDAANEYSVSEAYLVAHACLETGNGTSQLAKGVEYEGVTVYNMFGIGAYDGNALQGGASYAYAQGWTTPEAAVKGGAKWIAQNYIYRSKARQNTLYKMRWNPLSPGSHQYATDIGWAVKQAYIIAKIIGNSDCLQIFEIPVYSGTYTGYVPDVSPKAGPDISYSQPPEQAAPEEALAEPNLSDQISPEQISPEQVSPEQVSPEQVSPEQAATEKATEEILAETVESDIVDQSVPAEEITVEAVPVETTPVEAETVEVSEAE